MSAEGRLDTCGAIRCYQARGGGASRRVAPCPDAWAFRHAGSQAANDLVPDDPEPLVGLAKCISDRGARPGAAPAARARQLTGRL